jgi:[ribosomal protein S5]-alanine N-acetyltransferase
MKPILTTARLLLEPFSPGDIALMLALDRSSEVNRYVGLHFPHGEPTEQDLASRRARLERNVKQQLGLWKVVVRESQTAIGWAALKDLDQSEFVEVGYRFLPEGWGHGYATEVALRLLDFGFNDIGLAAIVGVTHPENLASQRVLTKAGLQHRGKAFFYKQTLEFFALERTRYDVTTAAATS